MAPVDEEHARATERRGRAWQRPVTFSGRAQLGIEGQRGLEQHLRAGGAVLQGGALGLVVAQAVFARHEDHGGRGALWEEDRTAAPPPEGFGGGGARAR